MATTQRSLLAVAVPPSLVPDLALGWWWADRIARSVIVDYTAPGAIAILRPHGRSS